MNGWSPRKFLLVGAAGVALLGAAPPLTQPLARNRSKVRFSLEGPYLSVTGSFLDYSGKVSYAGGGLKPGSVEVTIDASKVDIDSDDPRAELVIRELVRSLPQSRARFKSLSIKESAPSKLIVTGEVTTDLGVERLTVPIDILELSERRSRFRGKLSGEPTLEGPAALLLGDARGEVDFTLEFSGPEEKE